MTTTHRLTFEQVKGDQQWSRAEQVFIDNCFSGEPVSFSDSVPNEKTDDNQIRAGLLRHALLGGCEAMRVGTVGPYLRGAWIVGQIDLKLVQSKLALQLENCAIEEVPLLWDTKLYGLSLSGCQIPGLSAHRLSTEGPVYLSDGLKASGTIDLTGAVIGGHLACFGGRFDGHGGTALNCDAAQIGAEVFLDNGFHATGEVNFRGAVIGSQLSCTGGRFDGNGGTALNCSVAQIGAGVFLREGFHATGEVNFVGAVIGSQLSCVGGRFDGNGGSALNCNAAQIGASVFLREGFHAIGLVNFVGAMISGNLDATAAQFDGLFQLDSAQIGSGFFWHGIKGTVPILNLTEAKVGTLSDDAASWEQVEVLGLSGFRYDHIQSNMGISDRLAWLARKHERPLLPDMRQSLSHQPWLGPRRTGFDPQPYSQLAKVLEADGNRMGAARVLAEREDRLRAVEQLRAFGRLDGSVRAGIWSSPALLRQGWNAIFKYVFGYGHHPANALGWMLGIWLFGFILYGSAYASGQMVPNSDVILTSADWLAVATPYFDGSTDIRPAIAWADTPAGKDYETFSAALYALDLFVPLDALGQETTWAPSRAYGWLGTIAYWARMPIQLAGWIITAVGAAVLTGLIGRKE